MVDLHSHVLPDLDDGAASEEDAVGIARAAAADGVTIMAATPHVRGDYPTAAETMRERVESVGRLLESQGIPLQLVPGGEVALDQLRIHPARTLVDQFGLGGGSTHMLVEFPYESWPLDLAERLVELIDAGITPVLAHPERNPDVQAAPGRLAPLVAAGVLVQLTASSLTGRKNSASVRTARFLIDGELAHLVASDCHRVSPQGHGLAAARTALSDPELGRWLTLDVPESILLGGPLPARPARKRRRWPFRS